MIFTFYSYKGGVGRSMAMAGVAHLFARRGLRVLAIDFDLEAPGLERYFFDGERCRAVRAEPGLMDLIQSYQLALTNEAAFQKAEFKRWDKFRITAIGIAGAQGGSVDLMTAGRREPESRLRDYALAVRGFNWQDFFHNWKGDLFFDWFRRQIRDPATGYDVVLVDSRTGVTEMGGVCAYQLADAVVLLCAPNYQNLEGTRDVVRDFRSDSVLALRRGRPLEILAVPARIETHHPRRDEFLDSFARELGVDGMPKVLAEAGLSYGKLALPYLPQFAVAENLVGEKAEGLEGSGGREGGDALPVPPIDVFEQLADALTLLADPDSALGRQRPEALARLHGGEVPRAAALVADGTLSSAGYAAFIDYCWQDEHFAREVNAALDRAGIRTFLDSESILPGVDRQQAIDQALDYSDTLLVCFGHPTETEARARLIARARRLERIELIPVLLPGADINALSSFDLNQAQAVDLRAWPNEDAVGRLIARLRQSGRQHGGASHASTLRDPYPGDRPYTEDDAAFFCGRTDELMRLRSALASHELILLGGPARIGKTSLLKAGLLHEIRAGRGGPVPTGPEGIVWADFSSAQPIEPRPWLRDLAAPCLDAGRSADTHGLIVIDGIDDFSRSPLSFAAACERRLEAIDDLLQAAIPRARVILCWRDVLPAAQREAALARWGQYRFAMVGLTPLAGAALREAIEMPAKRAGHLLEPGLSERLIESAGAASNAIAQIQLTLAAMWPERRRGWLTNKSLDAVGHLDGVFERHRGAAMRVLDPPEARAAESLFKSLITLDNNFRPIAFSQPWDTLATIPSIACADAVALRDRLASASLIDLGRAPTPMGPAPAASADVVIALARPHPAAYFDPDSVPDLPFLMWRAELAIPVTRWRTAQDSPATLLRGSALMEAQEWMERRSDDLTWHEREFILTSARAKEEFDMRQQERAEAERHEREMRERERLEAAEKLAEEQGMRLQAEALARVKATQYAEHLKRGRTLLSVLLIACVILLFNVMQERSVANQRLLDQLEWFGWTTASRSAASDEPTRVEQSLLANRALQTQRALEPEERARRSAITIEYYAKTADQNKVQAALTGLGFTLVTPAAAVPDKASNAIWFDTSVDISDVKLVALTLIRAGVEIRSIRPLRQRRDRPVIQVGADKSVDAEPAYTVERIQEAVEFSR